MNKKKISKFLIGIPILILVLIIIILIGEPEREGISRGEAYKAAALLLTDRKGCQEAFDKAGDKYFQGEEGDVWYAKYMVYLWENGYLSWEENISGAALAEGYLTYQEAQSLAEKLAPQETIAVGVRHKKNDRIPADSWWEIYRQLRAVLDLEGLIEEKELYLYGTPDNIPSASAWTAYTSQGEYLFEGIGLDSYIDRKLKVLVKGGEMIALCSVLDDSVTYKNVWLVAGEDGMFQAHLGTVIRTFPLEDSLGEAEDLANQIADLSLKEGKLEKVTLKKEQIAGKTLSVTEDSIEIENYGFIPLDPDFKVYKLYGEFEEKQPSDILVGYDNQEFVVADGKICAALIVRAFDAGTIRVLLMNNNFQSIFHPSVTLSSEGGMFVHYGEEKTEIPAGAEVIINPTDKRLEEGRLIFTPVNGQYGISVNSITRSLGTPTYDGSIEIKKESEGLLIINELYLEDYLVKVVPSEMPDSYEKEALKAQAVCARTYAYQQIQSETYRQYGAHVDDSTRFQVYNNLEAGAKTEEAVWETYGKIIYYNDTPIEALYFSTSCGHTTDGSIWGSDPARYPYLDGCLLQADRGVLNLSTNKDFEAFIKNKDYPSYDMDYPMYRWETTVTNRQLEEEITAVGTILNISVIERGVGGIAKKIRIEGSDGVTTIEGEGQIRSNLGNSYMTVTRNDGSLMKNIQSLPSAYIAIENEGVDENNITTFRIYGGGYGHGVGMSQNGAQSMAKEGRVYEEILKFFFQGVEIKEFHSQGE